MYHYTYKIYFPKINKTYFGVRTSKVTPEEDKYLGSPKTNKKYWKTEELQKTILSLFLTREEAEKEETSLIKTFWEVEGKEKSLNAYSGGVNWNTLGRKRPESEMLPALIKSSKPFLFISPLGKIVEGVGLKSFCIKNGLHTGAMHAVLRGLKLNYKGWTSNFYNHLRIKYYGATPRCLKPVVLENEEYGKEPVFNRNAFCRKYGLSSSDITGVIEGKYKKIKGWCLSEDTVWSLLKLGKSFEK